MKKYFLGFSAIVLAIAFSAFTKRTQSADLKMSILANSVSRVQNPANFSSANGNNASVDCGASVHKVACTLLAVDPKYTHTVSGAEVLNTGTAGTVSTGNPDGEQILSIVGELVETGKARIKEID